MSDQTPPVRGFLSYTRGDNDAFDGIVDRLKGELAGKFYAQTGRKLELFLDRESIGWGVDWRDSIRSSVEAATIFIPVVSQAYFRSAMCREELLAFVAAADELGATDLVLPIVIAGANKITPDHPMPEVRMIERLNYKPVEDAYRDGYDSRGWRTKVGEMVDGLEAGVERAEGILLRRAEHESETPADVLGATVLLEEAQVKMQEAVDAFRRFSEAILQSPAWPLVTAGNAKQRLAAFVKLASDIREPALEFRRIGQLSEQQLQLTDTETRKILRELAGRGHGVGAEQRANLVTALNSINDPIEMVVAADRTIDQVKFLAMSSVPFRRAVEPAIEGMRSLRNIFDIVGAWSRTE